MRLWKVHSYGSGEEPLLFLLILMTKRRKFAICPTSTCLCENIFILLRKI